MQCIVYLKQNSNGFCVKDTINMNAAFFACVLRFSIWEESEQGSLWYTAGSLVFSCLVFSAHLRIRLVRDSRIQGQKAITEGLGSANGGWRV